MYGKSIPYGPINKCSFDCMSAFVLFIVEQDYAGPFYGILHIVQYISLCAPGSRIIDRESRNLKRPFEPWKRRIN